MTIPSDPPIKLTIHLADPDLDAEEQDEAAQRLLSQLKDLDEVESADRVLDPNPPAGNKSFGGFLPGRVATEVKPANVKPLFGFLSDRFSYKPIEVEVEVNGKTLKVKANSPEELAEVIQTMQLFISSNTSAATPTRKILILTANPQDSQRRRLDQEVRDITEGLRRSQQRDQFQVQQQWAVRPRDIQRAMLDINPCIVHFSGQGGESGLVFEDEKGNTQLVNGAALAGLFQIFADQVECVVLNGCYSEPQAEAIAQHINYVIGMNQAIGEAAAIEFAVGFYDALGAGRSVEFAYAIGCSAIQLAGIAENLTPVLKKKPRA
ncbi:MAG TPA: CHAT domain-containing protein [Coleofasciculaceae cyanobacterium]